MSDSPLVRLPNENKQHWQAVQDYARLGAGRSLLRLQERYLKDTGEPPTRSHQTLKQWSARFSWQARVDEFDAWADEQDEIAWAQRRREMKEADWADGGSLRDLGQRILREAPRFIRRTETALPDGNRLIVLALDAGLAIRALQAGSTLQRLATDEPTENTNLSGSALDAALARELGRLVDRAKTPGAGETAEAE